MVAMHDDMTESLRIVLSPELKDAFTAAHQRRLINQGEALRQILAWFCRQSEEVQGVILGSVPESLMPDMVKVILERLAADSDAAPPPRSRRAR